MPDLDNATIAALLERTADLLEITGADKFRVLSYRRAAHAVRSWPDDLSTLASAGKLTDVPGVGKRIATSISSALQTGSFAELDDLEAVLPPSLVTLLQIPGIGVKKAKVLYDLLGITSVDELEQAVRDGRVATLPGFGSKTAENILSGIASYRRFGQRVLLSDALPLAEKVASHLASVPGVVAAEAAGSVRRRKETVGDIDVLVASGDGGTVMAEVRQMPMVTSVIATGDTKTSIRTTSGLQVDVRVVEPDSWGTALQYFTGSAEHNVALRERAKSLGLKVSEYAVTRVADGMRVAGATEADVYAALGLAVPPPEIREATGEIEAAAAGALPHLIELSDIRGDLHIHSSATDGASTIEQNRERAAALGYDYLITSDHAWGLRMVGGLDLDDLERQWEHIDELNAQHDGPHVLKGIELNIDDEGNVDYPLDVLARFDLCVASLHSGWGQPREVATRRIMRAMDNPYVDIIGHPTGRILRRRDPIELDIDAVCGKAAETGTALELDAYPDRLDLSDLHLRIAMRHGVAISIGTDAHESGQMAYMRNGVWQARRGWVTPDAVLNAQPLSDLMRRLKRARHA
ncbi:MAG: DNA polymerase/3'-5' exonuclease PolX [Actinomycetia bacterium]|nr:DNA polymerase/3'-5' exonuclease PolX [Actinomycetes bacterium]